MVKIKICGITNEEEIDYLNELKPDYTGFVFAESKRKITPKRAEEIIQELPANVLKIGVFVNESVEVIQKITENCGLTHVQLHGGEDNYQIRRLNIPSIKSLGVTSESDMKNAQ
ncbi:MAG TPA: phosphoribosylanthranilate isomerase, partial [Clostridium sp.]|nr:phosphoribosylanthranilate isomerase [Clostridium sp.]